MLFVVVLHVFIILYPYNHKSSEYAGLWFFVF